MIKYITSAIILYLIFGTGLYLFQRKLLFNKSGIPNDPQDYELKTVKKIQIKVNESLSLLTWISQPKNNLPVIIYFHGNSFHIGERAYRIKHYIKEGYGIVIYGYRGFSGNKGTPTEKNLYDDAKSIIEWTKKEFSIKDRQIILYGESLGTGIAIQMAINKYYHGIILEAPFTSVPDVAQKMYPIYPVKKLIWDKFDNFSKINNVISPILFIHGKNDEIVPFYMGKKLYDQYNKKKENVFIDEAMHNNLYDYGISEKVINFIKNNSNA